MNIPKAYRVLRTEEIKEVASTVYTLKHEKSGARLILMACSDNNKVFNIIFRTPPEDDTGVPHIIEHTVLCGSERFPLKDPFIELAKGSLNTFLNAMTAPDKTMYPVASCNDQDFRNLMAVYADAVFHPNIYTNEKIFRQEGWHYELENEAAPLLINGVVYNEMKGAFSDPSEVMERENKKLLFPDTPYAFESGGDPEAIPSLTYEGFLNFHARYYHPSNSYIFLYGDMDFEERLEWLDREYLSHYDVIDPRSEIALQEPFDEMRTAEIEVAAAEGEDLSNADIFAFSKVVGGLKDPVEYLAFEVLAYALLNAPGAPIRRALQEAGIGTDIYGGYDSSFRQPIFGIYAKDAPHGRFTEFRDIILRELRQAAEEGIPEETLLAGINTLEFSMREGDYGRLPKGLVYCMQISDTWIHDEELALIHLKYDDTFRRLKAHVKGGYYQALIRKALIDNTHGVLLDAVPKAGLTDEKEEALGEKLRNMKAALSEEACRELVRETAELKAYQAEPTAPEDLKKLPMISVSDIRRAVLPFKNEIKYEAGIPVVCHDVHTTGIAYVDLYFSLKGVVAEDFPYVTLLKNLYAMMDTEQYPYAVLNDRISLYTGGISFNAETYTKKGGEVLEDFVIRGKAVYERLPELMSLIREIAFHTDFSDTKRMKDILLEMRTQIENSMENAGHSTALKRVLSYSSLQAAEDEVFSGVGFFRFLTKLLKDFDERKDEITAKLNSLISRIFARDGLTVSLTAEEEGCRKTLELLPAFADALGQEPLTAEPRNFVPEVLNEGFRTAGMVQYDAQGGNYKKAGYSYDGSMRVLTTLMRYEYLWNRVRVLGGAYGCMSFFGREGEMAFVSYRDPNLRETFEVFEGIPAYLESLEIDDRDMAKYIIGTISDSDTPLTPYMEGTRSFTAYRSGITEEELQEERDRVLGCTEEGLKALAPVVRAVLGGQQRCTVGSAAKLRECADLFMSVSTFSGETEGNEV